MLLREKLLTAELAAAKLGIREQGGNNRGPWIKKFLNEVGLPDGYAWCAAFQSYELHQVAGKKLPIESASVEEFYDYARRQGWLVTRPFKGDLVCYDFDGDGQYDDHIGLVARVLSIRFAGQWLLETVEGNTSQQGASGSQADGGGVFIRRRLVARKSVAFVRLPGNA